MTIRHGHGIPAEAGSSGGGGGLTSVDVALANTTSSGPLVADGTITLTWSSQAQYKVFAAPSSGAGTPSFRLLVAGDIPSLSATYALASHTHDAADVVSGRLALARGGTHNDMSATGGAGFVVMQESAGANFTARLLADADISFTDVTTGNATSAKHGFQPKSPADATKFLNGAATPAYALVKDSDLSTSDITTNDASTAKHGFMAKLGNVATNFFDGTGAQSDPRDVVPQVIAQTPGATVTIDASTFHAGATGFATLAMGGNYTLTWSNGTAGQKIVLIATQDGTGSRTLAYTGATCKFSTTVPSPTLSTTAAKVDIQMWLCVSSAVWRLMACDVGF